MVRDSTLEKVAFSICREAHAGQLYGDVEYFYHPLSLANEARLRGFGSLVVSECLIHDVFEDTPLSPKDVCMRGIPLVVIWGAWCMTYLGDDTDEKIALARSNPLSHIGKHIDAGENRRAGILSNDHRVPKYDDYLARLEPDLPTIEQVEQYCSDFAKTSAEIESEIEGLKLRIRDAEQVISRRAQSRVNALLCVLRDQASAKELIGQSS